MAPHIIKTNRPVKVPLDIQLFGFIWIMATPDCYKSVAERFKMNRDTLLKIYRIIISTVVSEAHRYIQWPTNKKKDKVKTYTYGIVARRICWSTDLGHKTIINVYTI